MKAFLPLLLLLGLLAAPEAAFSAASDAALLWWTRVLPSLLPYLIVVSLLERSGLFLRLPKRIAPLLLLPFGMLGGYPAGAKLAGRLCRDGAIGQADARKAAILTSFPNPVFLLSVVSAGLFHTPRAALPLLCGVCLPALFGLIPLSRIRMTDDLRAGEPFSAQSLPEAIKDGVRTILTIGGCLVFASVLGALIEATGVLTLFGAGAQTARAILLGTVEMTCGVQAAAGLSIPLAVRLAFCAFFVQFGGISVYLQCASLLSLPALRWFPLRLLFGAVSALVAYLAAKAFLPNEAVSVFASADAIVRNTLDLVSVALASGFGLLLIYVFTAGLKRRKKTP
ncbi:MAG: hypothetical protein IJJ86_03940 [Clostridia bacterium]|nr:hypothetical protein [Clostridia bacterium]